MGSTTTYFCDRCGITVGESGLEYIEIKQENASDDRPTRTFFGLCEACAADCMGAFNAAMAQAGVA